ncbi:hypothetical protein D3C84_1175210 [compost metagenome]
MRSTLLPASSVRRRPMVCCGVRPVISLKAGLLVRMRRRASTITTASWVLSNTVAACCSASSCCLRTPMSSTTEMK